jgi:hypothetical protein
MRDWCPKRLYLSCLLGLKSWKKSHMLRNTRSLWLLKIGYSVVFETEESYPLRGSLEFNTNKKFRTILNFSITQSEGPKEFLPQNSKSKSNMQRRSIHRLMCAYRKFDMPAERLSAIRTRTPANCLTLFHHPPNRPVPQQRTMPTKKAPFIEEDEEEEVAGRVEAEGNDNNMVPAQPDSPPPPYVPDEIVAETDALPSVQPIPPEVSAGRIESKAIPAALIETHSTASSSLQGDAQDGSKSGEGEKTDVQSADAEYNAKQVRLNGDIQFLLDHRRSAVAAAASASPVEQTTGARRRRGGLGRAPSSNSMPGPFTMFQQISMDAANAPDSAPPAHPLALEDVETVYDEEVTYDTKDAQVQREKMSAMLGTDVGNNSTRTIVPSVGRVRDTGSFADDGRRIMRKRRPKSKNPSD